MTHSKFNRAKIIDYSERPDPSAVEQLTADNIHAPMLIAVSDHRTGLPVRRRAAGVRAFAAPVQAFLAVDPTGLLVVYQPTPLAQRVYGHAKRHRATVSAHFLG